MPRIKAAPYRKTSTDRKTVRSDLDETVLDGEEIERLEQELESIRHEKAKQIRKMRIKREERRNLYNDSPYSSDSAQLSEDEENLKDTSVNARQSTRDLANGFEKAQQRFMFNVRHIEEKYRERERLGAPESKVEIDRYGNFYFPETMAGGQQQAFVNRMFHNDALFGKGSVSAPRNSIQSFEGDARALKKSVELDKKFGMNSDRAEQYDCQSRERRIYSSSYVSGIPIRASSPAQKKFRFDSRYNDDLDDDVFESNTVERRVYQASHLRTDRFRQPSTSKTSSFPRKEETSESSEDEEFAEDEESSEASTYESFSEDDDEEDDDDRDEKTPVTERISKDDDREYRKRSSKDEEETPSAPRYTSDKKHYSKETKNLERTPISIGMPANHFPTKEILQDSKNLEKITPPANTPVSIKREETPSAIPIKSEILGVEIPLLKTENISYEDCFKENSNYDFNRSTTSQPKDDTKLVEKPPKNAETVLMTDIKSEISTTNTSTRNEDIRKYFQVKPKPEAPRKSDEPETRKIVSSEESRVVPIAEPHPKKSPTIISKMALEERPVRAKKPTEKMAAILSDSSPCHGHSPEGAAVKRNSLDGKKKKNVFCKHCEYVKEEKRKSKLNAKQLKDDIHKASNGLTVDAAVTAVTKVQESASNESTDKINIVKQVKNSKKNTPKDQKLPVQVKRRSGTVAAEEPEKKKQKLIESDLISIPSSMAIIVDTELIATENPALSASVIPKFSENFPSTSVWSSPLDVQWIKDVKKVRGKTKDRRFFGVPVTEYPEDVPIINFWVNNLLREDRDPFEQDLRRMVAQDKKARIDMKAGYDVR